MRLNLSLVAIYAFLAFVLACFWVGLVQLVWWLVEWA